MSKALKALESIRERVNTNDYGFYDPDAKRDAECDVIEKALKALEIIKECLVAEFSLYDKGGEYFIVFHFDGTHELTFKLKDKIEYELLKEVLL